MEEILAFNKRTYSYIKPMAL